EGKSGTSTITVTPVPVASVEVTPASASVPVGQSVQLTGTPRDAGGNPLSGRTVTWSSSNTAAATVSNSGLVSGVTPGSATITATSEGKSGTSAITVTPVPVASVEVTPATASVQAGQTVQLTATPKDANGAPLSGRTVTWSSSNTAVATVSNSGLVSGVTPGSATITATSEGKSGTSSVTVTNVPVATVDVTPPSASVQAGQTVQLTGTPRDAGGNPLSGRTVTWSSSNTAVATVSNSGLVSGVTPETRPLLLTVATAVLELDHVTVRPESGFPPASLGVPVSCTVWPACTDAEGGVTSTVATGTFVTVTDEVPLLPSLVAVIVAEPGVTPETSPLLLTVATAVLELDHVTVRPESGAPFASFGVAVSCTV